MVSFPENFLWGVSTSAHQFEGGNIHNQWHSWERSGRTRSGELSGVACDWWLSAERDLDLCAGLGLNALRISLDWGRLEPQEGRWDESAFERYRAILRAIRERGMRPFVVLHHFTHPQWFEDAGGFLDAGSPDRFCELARRAVEELGELCSDWLTFNEPNVYSTFGYWFGEFPPGKYNDMRECAVVLANIHRAHALAYGRMHKLQPGANVGLTTNWTDFKPASAYPADQLLAYMYDAIFNRSSLHLLRSGSFHFPFNALASDVPEVIQKTDFAGVNIYSRLHVRLPWAEADRRTGGTFVPDDVPQGDCGAENAYGEACPDAVITAVNEYAALGVPIYVMENGVPDRSDRIRPWMMVRTLANIGKLIESGHDIRGYFHWSIVDNYEWSEGWTLRFGLYELDLATQERRARGSAEIYRQIIAQKGISDELSGRFALPPVAGSHPPFSRRR